MKPKLTAIAFIILLTATALAWDRYSLSETRQSVRTFYHLNLKETREAALLWLSAKGLSTNGIVTAYPNSGYWDGNDSHNRGITIIIEIQTKP